MHQENLVKVLAKPTLVALNGQEAAFLAGGEFPIPVPQAFGLVTIQFKKFGVGLVFTPNVLDKKHISLSVAPEVSEFDFPECLADARIYRASDHDQTGHDDDRAGRWTELCHRWACCGTT